MAENCCQGYRSTTVLTRAKLCGDPFLQFEFELNEVSLSVAMEDTIVNQAPGREQWSFVVFNLIYALCINALTPENNGRRFAEMTF